MKLIPLTLYFILASFFADAQIKKDHYILKFGVRSVNVRTENAFLKDDFFLKPVIDIGFGLSYKLSNNLHFQPELHYNPKGFKSRLNLTDSTFVNNSLELHYLDLCPNFSYTFGNYESRRTKVNVWAGPYIGFGIGGRNVLSGQAISPKSTRADSTYSIVNKTFSNGLNRMDYGFNLGIGLQFENITQIGLSYSRGFNNILNDKSMAVYNQSVGVYVLVLFDDIF